MLEKFGEFAERAATNASRRQFFGRLGRGALTAAAAVGGMLALSNSAQAAARYCGRGSTLACFGKQVGDPCNLDNYVVGFCRANGGLGCSCVAKK